MDNALELLGFRARSESELESRLRQAGHEPAAAASALQRCRELGYLDDRAFALAHVRDRLRLRPKGRRALRSELFAKGIDADLAEAAIAEAFVESGLDETDLARRLAARRTKALVGLEPDAARRRLSGYLTRRGFPPPVVRDVVADAFPAGDAASSRPPARSAD